jgi:aryl-alcohol dehydrogenase-like predicted oxidoreductase
MEHVSLGGLDVSRLGLGTMGMSAFYTGAAATRSYWRRSSD